MDLEEVWKIRLDRFRFSGKRYITGSGSGGCGGCRQKDRWSVPVLYLKTGYGKVLLQWLIP